MSDTPEEVEYDPFGADTAQAQLIVSMKIYDVLMALLQGTAPAVAEHLDELHSNGVVLGLGPQFSGFHTRDGGTSQSEAE